MPTKIGEIWTNALDLVGQAWWVEIATADPKCVYYFGPFANAQMANLAQAGYIADLQSEQAQIIQVQVKRCKPSQLTIDGDDLGENRDRELRTALSGQV
jgi:Domain of unknown function (DUF1816)